MNRAILVLLLLALALTANAQDASPEPKVGDRAASGNLVLYVFHQAKTRKPLPAELTTDYGFMVISRNEDDRKPIYRLANRAEATVEDFNSFEEFSTALAKLPKGSVLHHYDKCLVPTSWGFRYWQQLERACKRLGLSLSEQPHLTCNCPEK